MSVYQLKKTQFLKASKEEVWSFICNPANLTKITPDHLGFKVLSESISEEMYPGMIIKYKVSPLFNIPMTWVTEITHVEKGSYFVDEQRVGPYKIWHHEHHLIEVSNGVELLDIITYQPPLGILGDIANTVLIKRDLEEIFEYRRKVLDRYFN